ncbi:hypothetical protein EG68_07207 [Paragonimus skrjabini miyazakii]|uniref:Uncharacterized protein n=1 Tax=Paragonimus skrjabini miyazakii TaxID=59628 RepID=A0A8S9YPJ0_9TREM|nr:hypothetical protein EG68_07207 [Paragonimus skrjabini miyazakii]
MDREFFYTFVPRDDVENFWMYAILFVMIAFIGFTVKAIIKIWREKTPSNMYRLQLTPRPTCNYSSEQD